VVATTCRYERGERIFDEGATSEFFYTVASGSVKLVKTSCRGHDCIVGIASGICPLNPDGLSFPATAVALEDTTCLLVPKRELVALFEKNPTAAQRLWDELCESLDAGFTWTAEFGHGTVEVRLARFFLRLARTAGRPQESVTFIPVPLSRQELADAVGTAIETCIRLMSRWEERCLIYACDGGFMVSDEEQLELLAAVTTPHPDGGVRRPTARLPPAREVNS
jgi:CRP/FNR family transcriptional regulator